jgi:integrase
MFTTKNRGNFVAELWRLGMARSWISSKKFRGVRWLKHPSRKHGVKFDRRFGIRFFVKGKQFESLLGWESAGWNEGKAYAKRQEFIANVKRGVGPTSLDEELAIQKKVNEARQESEAREQITFLDFFHNTYFPTASAAWKEETARKHAEHVKNWLAPVLGSIPLKDVGIIHINKIKANMTRGKRAPRTMQYVFRTFSMVWESARDHGLVGGVCPTKAKSFKLPKIDNARERFLKNEEAARLLDAVKARSEQTYCMALLSLETGMRFSEIAGLQWGCIDLESSQIRVLNAKGDKSRTIPITQQAHAMLSALEPGNNRNLVFPNSLGAKHLQVPSAFKRAVAESGLNEDLHDSKLRFSFHGLRHTYASRLIEAGAELIHVQRLLGHSTPVVTDRYSHLREGDLATVVKKMENRFRGISPAGKVISIH